MIRSIKFANIVKVLAIVALAYLVSALVCWLNTDQIDSGVFWATGQAFWNGENPYVISGIRAELNDSGIVSFLEIYHTPTFISLLWVTNWVDPKTFRQLLLTLSFIALVASLTLLPKIVAISGADLKRKKFSDSILWLAVFALPFRSVAATFFNGQISLLLLLALVGCIILFERAHGTVSSFRSAFTCGLVTSLLLIKPNLLYLIWPSLVFAKLKISKKGIILGLLTGAFCLLAPALIKAPQVITWFLHAPRPWYSIDHSMGSLIQSISPDLYWLRLIPLLIGIIWWLVWFFKDGHCNLQFLLRTVIPLSLATTPYVWSYDFVLLFPSIALLLKDIEGLPRPYKFISVAALLILNLLVLLCSPEALLLFYPLIFLVLLNCKGKRVNQGVS